MISKLTKKVKLKLASMYQNQLQKASPFEPKFHTRLIIALWGLVVVLPILTLVRINIKEAQAVWSPTMGAWMRRQLLNIVNSSTVTLHTNTTVAVTVDTKALVGQGRLKSDCSDIRILYQPDSSTNTELTRHLVYPGGSNCSSSTATKVYFSLQADITTTDTTNDYYLYFDNPQASTPSNTDNAFDIGEKQALLVCPFEGTTTCAAGETPSTATGALRYSAGKSAMSFDGVNDKISTADIDAMDGVSLLTLEAWVYRKGEGSYDAIIDKTSDWNSSSISFLLGGALGGDDDILARIGNGGNTYGYSTSNRLTINTWHHVAMIFDGSGTTNPDRLKIYIDGESQTLTFGGTIPTTTNSSDNANLNIGYYTAGTNYFNGQIDEVRISNTVRYSSNFTPSTTPFVRDAYTKLLYHMDENGDDPRQTGKVMDDSGNGYHGTITGAKYVNGLVGVDNSSTTTGNLQSGSYASRDGIFVEEGTTNKITNPSFENDTYNTNWSSQGEWWLAGGISSSSVVSVYQPKGASSLAASYINLANPGTYNLSVGVAPQWSTDTGWTFTGTQYLYFNGPIIRGSVSKYANAGGTNNYIYSRYLNYHDGVNVLNSFIPRRTWDGGVSYHNSYASNGGVVTDNTNETSGVVIITNTKGYHNTAEKASLTMVYEGTGNIYVGTYENLNASTMYQGDISAIAFYNAAIDSYVSALTNAVNEIPSGVTTTDNTTAQYYKFGSHSVKVVSSANYPSQLITAVNPGNTNTHTLSAYVYDGTSGNVGGTVSASIAKLVFNGSSVTPSSYTDMGGGWWRLTYSAAGVNASGNYGVEVMSGKTVYIDGVQLEEKSYATTYTDGSLGTGYAWTGTANDSTSTRTAIDVAFNTTNNISGTRGTVSMWVKPYHNGTDYTGTRYASFGSSDAKSMRFVIADALLYAEPNFTSNMVSRSASVLSKDKWSHIVLTYDSTATVNGSHYFELYVNGTASGNTYTGDTTWTPPAITSYHIGADFNGSSNWGNTNISDFKVYDTALTSDEVSDLYYSGLISKSDTYATVTVDNFQDSTVLGATTTNKITNPSFENSTFSTNWSATQEYTLQDEFTDTQGAGSVNGTTSTDSFGNTTGATRTVTDTGNNMLTQSGELDFTGGSSWGDPGLWYPSTTRIQGKLSTVKFNVSNLNDSYGPQYGWDSNNSGSIGGSGNIIGFNNISLQVNGGTAYIPITSLNDIQLVTVLQNTGHYYFIKGGGYTNWTLVYLNTAGSSSPLYPSIGNYGATLTTDYFRIPTSTFLPSPLAYDTFTTAGSSSSEANGPDGQVTPVLSWTGGTKAGGKMSISPTLGSEQVNDVGFDNPANWLLGTGWNVADSITTKTPGSSSYLHNTVRPTIGNWYQLTGTVVRNAGNVWLASGGILGYQITSSGTHTNTMRADNVSYHGLYANASFDGTVDDFSAKPITTSSLFSTVSTSDKDIIASTDITYITGTQAGLVTNLDSTSSPNNFLIAYLTATSSGAYINLSKNVGGTYTNLINNASFTYVSGATLRVITYHSDASTLKVRVYYNNALVGSEQTITDASIRDNTIHGLFSTYSGNTFDNFTLFARGSDGEYSSIPDDPSTHLTAEENTTNTYNKSGGKSVKLTNTNATYPFEYVTAINPGNTNTHTLSAYVYNATSGSVGGKVDSSVAKLVFNGSVVTPSSYTQVDGNWWRLTYSGAGVNASGDYGIEVQAGKTLYMDSVQLEEGSSATTYVDGSLGRGFEWTGTVNNSTSQRICGEGKGESPISIWHMDEGYGTTANDSSINLNALTVSGATWSNTTGNGGKYLTFDGTDDKLSRTMDTDFDFGTDTFTLSGLFRHTSTVSGTDTILSRQSGNTGYKVYMDSSGYICFSVNSDSSCTTASYADSKWHSFSAVRGTENIKLFIDGDEKALTNQSSPATVNGNNTLYLGIDNDGTSNPWTGDLDEISIYPYARTSTQVLTDNLGTQVSTVLASNTYDPLTQGLVGWWKMDETATPSIDSSGNGNSGTWNGDVAATTGKFGNGVAFDGTGDYIDAGTGSSLDVGLNDFTVEAWVKPDPTWAAENIISPIAGKKYTYNVSRVGYFLELDYRTVGVIQMRMNDGSTSNDDTPTNTVDIRSKLRDGTWRHIAASVNNAANTVSFYFDGQYQSTVSYTKTGTLSNNWQFTIAQEQNATPAVKNFKGSMDDVRVYNRALNNEEVMALYKYAPGPVAHWKLDEGTGQYAYDASGNGYTGNLTNSPTWETGRFGKGILTSNTNDSYITFTPNVSPASYISVGMWLKKQGSGTYLFSKAGGGTRMYRSNDNVIYAVAASGGTNTCTSVSTPLNDNSQDWHYYAMTFDGTTLRGYLDGKLECTDSTYSGTVDLDGQVWELARRPSVGATMTGIFDDFKIYNYARSPEQVVSDMNASHPIPGSPVGSALAHYKFDEGYGVTANNSGSGGSSLNGTLTNMSSPATSTSGWANNGKFGKALSFDGSDDFVSLGDNDMFSFGNSTTDTPFSVSGWVYLRDATYSSIASKWNSATTLREWILYTFSDDKVYFYLYDESTDGYIGRHYSTALTSYQNSWIHLTATYDGSASANGIRIYLNGNRVDNTNSTSGTYTAMENTAETVKIGKHNSSSTDRLTNGSIDEVKLYNFALSPDQIKTEYNKGSALVLGSNTDSGKVIASDSFNKSSMGTTEVGNYTWSGSTWSVANGKAVNTPTEGSNLVTNGTFDTDTGWTKGEGWTIANGTAIATATWGSISQTIPSTYWIVISNDLTATAAFFYHPPYDMPHRTGASGTFLTTTRLGGTSLSLLGSYGFSGTIDNVSAKALTLSSLFATVPTSHKDVIINTDVTMSSGTQAGVAANINNANTPTAGLIAYYDGYYIKLDKFTTATTWTNLINTAATYVAGAKLQVITYHSDANTLKVKVFYNGAQVGTEQTITDTAIINNTIHGLFSTYSGNMFDNFKLETNTQNTVQDYCVPGSTDYCGSPIAQLNFDEGTGQYAYDTTGNANAGTLGSGATADASDPTWIQGKAGKGLKFDGNDYLRITSSLGTQITNGFTMSFWMKATSAGNDNNPIGLISNGGAPTIQLRASSFRLWPSTVSHIGGSYTLNSWVYVTFTYDEATYQLYLNGALAASGADTTAILSDAGTYYIGSHDGTERYFQGIMDDIKVYNYVRTSSQVAWDYNRGKALIHLKFDEESGSTAYDSSGNSTNGTITGATVSTSGKLNNALSFDGSDDYVDMGNPSSADFTTGFSISSWFKANETQPSADSAIIAKLGPEHDYFGYMLWYRPAPYNAVYLYMNGGVRVTASTTIVPGTWYHVITTWDGTTPKIYINGKLAGTGDAYTTAPASSSYNLSIGQYSFPERKFAGLIDEVKIFNYPLTVTQIKDLYNGGSIRFDK